MMTNLVNVILLFFLSSSLLFAQNNIDLNSLPNIQDYIVTNTNPNADTIILGLHGGPTDMLYPGDFSYFNSISTFSVVEMMQHQHNNPSIIANSNLTLEDAITHNDTTVAMIKKVVDHFNGLNKTVVLMGHSFGAFLLTEYLDDYGINDLHRIIPMAGRLNMDQVVVNSFESGYFASFLNGQDIVIETIQAPSADWAAMKLQAGLGYNRHIDSLASLDLSKLMYVYGTHDEAVGRLSIEETTMLGNANATLLAVQNGDHDSPFFLPQMIQILDFIRTPQTTGISESNLAQSNFKLFPTLIEETINIELETNGILRIININGQLIQENHYSKGKHFINATNFTSGYYLASFKTEKNGFFTMKFIVK